MSSENAVGLSRGAFVSLGVFALLLGLVVVTHEDKVEVGVQKLELPEIDKAQVTRIEIGQAPGAKPSQGEKKDSEQDGNEKKPETNNERYRAVLEKDGEGWIVYDPAAKDVRYAVEQSAVDSVLSALEELSTGAFVTGREEKHGELEIDDEKGLRVKVTAGTATLDLVFGRYAKGGGNYMREAGSDKVFVGKGRLASLVKKDVKGWRKRKLLDLEADAFARITVEKPGAEAYTLEGRKEGGSEQNGKKTWAFAANTKLPEGFRADESALSRLVTTFAGLRAADFSDDSTTENNSDDETGLAEGARVTGVLEDGKRVVVRFGKEDKDKRVYAKVEGDPQLYLVAGYSASSILKDKLELRDLTLAPFDAAKAERVVFRAPTGTVELEKKDGAWSLVSEAPAGFEFDPAIVESKLGALARLRGASLVESTPAPSTSGLDNPGIAIDITLEGGEQTRIAFGKDAPKGESDGAEVFAEGQGGLVYRVASFQKTRYEKPLELFKRVAPPPSPPAGMGGMNGLDQLPPEVRKQLEQAMGR